MKRYTTDRLLAAVSLSGMGALLALLGGIPEAALFVAPWLVLCVLGMSRSGDPLVHAMVEVVSDRVMIDDSIHLRTVISAADDALVKVTPHQHQSVEAGAISGEVDLVLASGPTVITTELRAREWGTHDIGRMQIEAVAPYGLFLFHGTTSRSALVRVHPTPLHLRQLLAPSMVRRLTGSHRSNESARGVEYADIREFAPGDSARDINWRASARSPNLWVSQRQPDRLTDVVLLVDSFVEPGHDVRAVFALVVEAALAIAQSHLVMTDRVGLIEFGGLVRWIAPGAGPVQLQRLADALLATRLFANAAHKDFPVLAPRTLPPRSFVIAFTPLLDDRFIEALLTARGRGHDVAVIECAPIGETLYVERSDYQQISLKLWQAERTMLRDRLADHGVAVVQCANAESLDATLNELTRRRRGAARVIGH